LLQLSEKLCHREGEGREKERGRSGGGVLPGRRQNKRGGVGNKRSKPRRRRKNWNLRNAASFFAATVGKDQS